MSFPNITIALVAGVCGGAPSYNERQILLGDVVISDGVVQYDLGWQYPNKFEIIDTLNDRLSRPNMEVRGLLAKLRTTRQGERLRKALQTYLDQLLQDSSQPTRYPGRSNDHLFPADYRHKHQNPSQCAQCASYQRKTDPVCEEATKLTCNELGCDIKKNLRGPTISGENSYPVVHFGTVASADTVLKSGEDRDDLTGLKNVIAFEMESAGIWDVFPCVMIKGVCDYADSHKNKEWQSYAAASAAACTKAFLGYWAPTEQ